MSDDSYLEASCPPLLRHQQGSAYPSECSESGSFETVYRSIPHFDDEDALYTDYADEYGLPLYRSISAYLSEQDAPGFVHGDGASFALCPVACVKVPPPPVKEFQFELPREVFECVLSHLPSHPDLFNAMAVNRYWHEAACATYAQRIVHIPTEEDALLEVVAAATPGDTLLLQDGVHWLTAELVIEKPLRIYAESIGAVIASRQPSLLRTRATVVIRDITLCRMGNADGYPNAVVVGERVLTLERCRITCGGLAPTIEDALQVFGGAPVPGTLWDPAPQEFLLQTDNWASPTRQGPQSGVWVGACASVTLRRCIIACCSGPGIKIYRGQLVAEHNTIAFSRCGANVVSNSGRVTLSDNAIHGARGDGVSSWNNTHLVLERNTIYANAGTGITVNTGGGSVSILQNTFFGNSHTAVQFATSNVKHVNIGAGKEVNDWSGNSAGGLQGLDPRSSSAEHRTPQLTPNFSKLPPQLVQGNPGRGSAESRSGRSNDSMENDSHLDCVSFSSSQQGGWSMEM